jgi:hypothetical protein
MVGKSRPAATRDSVLNLIAETLQGFARREPAARRASPSGDEGAQGDFLEDLVRLHIEYVNELARLGSNHSIIASRLLERLYDYSVPEPPPDEMTPIVLEGRTGARLTVRIDVTNDLEVSAAYELSCSDFRADPEDKDEKPTVVEIEFQHPKRKRSKARHRVEFQLDGDESEQLRLVFKLPSSMTRGASYYGQLVVERRRTGSERALRVVHPVILRRLGK